MEGTEQSMVHSVWGLVATGTVQRVGMMRRLQKELLPEPSWSISWGTLGK